MSWSIVIREPTKLPERLPSGSENAPAEAKPVGGSLASVTTTVTLRVTLAPEIGGQGEMTNTDKSGKREELGERGE